MQKKEHAPFLIYAHFGDIRAIAAISAINCQFRARSMSLEMKAKSIQSLPSAWWWAGKATVGGRDEDEYEVAVAVIHERDDSNERFKVLGLERGNCLLIVGDHSTYSRDDGLLRLYAGYRNEAHLRNFNLYPLKEWGRKVAVQVIQSFVANRFLHERRPSHRKITTRRLIREAGLHLVKTPRQDDLPDIAALAI